jgi:hypothetical protein
MPRTTNPIYVRYQDHATATGHREPNELDIEPIHLEAVGWVVYEDERALVLGGCRYYDNDMVTTVRTHIVKCCIVEREEMMLYED